MLKCTYFKQAQGESKCNLVETRILGKSCPGRGQDVHKFNWRTAGAGGSVCTRTSRILGGDITHGDCTQLPPRPSLFPYTAYTATVQQKFGNGPIARHHAKYCPE